MARSPPHAAPVRAGTGDLTLPTLTMPATDQSPCTRNRALRNLVPHGSDAQRGAAGEVGDMTSTGLGLGNTTETTCQVPGGTATAASLRAASMSLSPRLNASRELSASRRKERARTRRCRSSPSGVTAPVGCCAPRRSSALTIPPSRSAGQRSASSSAVTRVRGTTAVVRCVGRSRPPTPKMVCAD